MVFLNRIAGIWYNNIRTSERVACYCPIRNKAILKGVFAPIVRKCRHIPLRER